MQHLQFLQAAEVSTVHTLVVGWRTRLRTAKRRVRLCRRPGTEFISASDSIRLLQCPLCSSNNIHEEPTEENALIKSNERHSRTSPPWSVPNTLFFSPHMQFLCARRCSEGRRLIIYDVVHIALNRISGHFTCQGGLHDALTANCSH